MFRRTGADEKWDPCLWSAVALGMALAAASAAMALLRFHTLGNTNSDIAFYTRVVWGLAHGDRINTLLGAHDLGLHLMPMMWVFAPLSYILPIPETLLVANALALGAVAPLLFRLGRRLSGAPLPGLALAGAWCLFPSTLQIGCREFHPSTLALPLLVAALDALHARRHRLGIVLLAVACMAREDVALAAAGAGAALALDPERRKLGGMLTLAGLAWFAVYVLAVQPGYLPQAGSIEAHFSGCGHSASEVGLYLLTHPVDLARRVCSAADITYILVLLGSAAGLPLLSARWLLPAALPLALNLLSDFPASVNVQSHYVALILPGLFMAAAVGLARLHAWRVRGAWAGRVSAAALVLAALLGHAVHGATPISMSWHADTYRMDRNEGILSWYTRAIALMPELSVTAPAAALNHLAERSRVYSVMLSHPKPDVAIFDIRGRQWVRLAPERWETPTERQMQRLDADPRYGTWRFNPPYRAVWRGRRGGAARHAAVSPGRVPEAATPQNSGWPGHVDLLGLEARLSHEREQTSGEYNKRMFVRMTFYWRAERRLPAGLLIKAVIKGDTKTHRRYLLPTFGVRDTATWRPGEIIKDEQWTVSPGGWPLEALSATVQLIRRDGSPYPQGAQPVALKW